MSLTSFAHFLLCAHLHGLLVLMMHAEQLPPELGAKYAERHPCEGHHRQEVLSLVLSVHYQL
jgi:hypothetical protein